MKYTNLKMEHTVTTKWLAADISTLLCCNFPQVPTVVRSARLLVVNRLWYYDSQVFPATSHEKAMQLLLYANKACM